jgi:Lon protease-like protein
MTEREDDRTRRVLPRSLPIFPLTGVLLLPRGRLPLNIFEPRYLRMTDDALASDRMIGMIQPSEDVPGQNPPVYSTGCAGRITAFAEEGSRYLITLTGVARFDVVTELATTRGYRRIVPDWSAYEQDLEEAPDAGIDRPRLLAGLKTFFKHAGLSADWSQIDQTPDERLITSLAMICPFAPAEKQALLQAKDVNYRSKLLIGLVETAILHSHDGKSRH